MSDDSSSAFESILRGSAIVFIGFGFEMLISFTAKLLISRYLSRVEYGEVSLGITIMTLVTTISMVGLNTGLGRYIPRFDTPSGRGSVVRSALEITLPIAVLNAALIAVFAEDLTRVLFDNGDVERLVWIFAATIPLVVLFRMAVGIIQGQQRSKPKVLLGNLLLPGVRLGLIAAAVLVGLGPLAFAGAYLVSYLVVAVAAAYYIVTRVDLPSSGEYEPLRGELVSFSAPLMLTTTITVILSNIDTVMLGYFSTTSDVGIYNVVFPLTVAITVFLVSFRFIVMPQISELHSNAKTDEIRRVYALTSKWIIALSSPVLFVFLFFPSQAITLTFGGKYSAGAPALTILSLGFFTHAIAGPNGATLTSIGETKAIMWINIFTGICNLGLNVLLIPRYSFIGAAIATGGSYTLMNLLYSWQLYDKMGITPFNGYTGRVLGITTILFVVFAGLKNTIVSNLENAVFVGAVLMTVYFTLLVTAMISEPEEQSFLTLVIDYLLPW